MVTGGPLTQPARVEVLEGFTNGVNATRTAIGFASSSNETEGEGYVLGGAVWSSSEDNSWQDPFDPSEGESCIPRGSNGQKALRVNPPMKGVKCIVSLTIGW
jgi:hypothetical protein